MNPRVMYIENKSTGLSGTARIGRVTEPRRTVRLRGNTAKHYGDVMHSRHVLHFVDVTDVDEVDDVLRKAELDPRLEVGPGRFAFWKPDDAEYQTQSEPKKRAVEQ